MLSSGKYHQQVPRDVVKNLLYRREVLLRAAQDRQLQRALIEACRRDILFYVNTFVWQLNPRKKGSEVGPFVTWDFQDEAFLKVLLHVERDEDLLIEKSREMGASWLCLIVMDWLCLFHHWKKFLVISHTEDAVDRPGDSDSLFWKVQFMHDHLPAWLVGEASKAKLSFNYPRTSSSMNGAATTARAGVGGRATAAFLDEFSKQRDDFAILGQTADTTGCRIFNGTHYGLGTAFYELTLRPDLKKLVMHWTQHPDKRQGLYHYDPDLKRVVPHDPSYQYPPDYRFVTDGTPTGGPFPGLRSPWYDRECARRGNSRDVAMHLDIDPQGSTSQFFNAITIRTLQNTVTRSPVWTGELHYDRDRARPLGLVKVDGGNLRLWFQPDADGKVPAARYAMGADIAVGTGATPSCLSIGNADTGEKVAEYSNAHISPEHLAAYAVSLCWLFGDLNRTGALFAWEMAGPGLKFGKEVVERYGYTNIYYRIDEFDGRAKRSDKPGWYPAPNAKNLLLSDYRAALESRQFLNQSFDALKECLAFEYGPRGDVFHGGERNTADPTKARENHGDMTIADALLWKMMMQLGTTDRTATPEAEVAVPMNMGGRRRLALLARSRQDVWN